MDDYRMARPEYRGNETASGMAAAREASAGTVTKEIETAECALQEVHVLLSRIDERLAFQPQPEGVKRAEPDDTKSGMASRVRVVAEGLKEATHRIRRIADAL